MEPSQYLTIYGLLGGTGSAGSGRGDTRLLHAHPAMVCAQMCGKGKENSAHGVGCAYGSKRIHAAEQGRFPATAKLMLFAHVHPSACAIGMSILGL